MKAKLIIELEFDPWFNEPKTEQEWADYFNKYLMPESSVIGEDDELIALERFTIECEKIIP